RGAPAAMPEHAAVRRAALARGRLREKREALEAALTGRLREHHGCLLTSHREPRAFLNRPIAPFSAPITAPIDRRSTPPPAPAAAGGAAPAAGPGPVGEHGPGAAPR